MIIGECGGIRSSISLYLDEASARKIKSDPRKAIGKLVSIVGDFTVSLDTSKSVPIGKVKFVKEETKYTEDSISTEFSVWVDLFEHNNLLW